jgi:hypothetical protein
LPFDTIVGIAKEHKAMSTFWGTKSVPLLALWL